MGLADHQRGLAALLAGRDPEPTDAHLRDVAGSTGLEVLRWSVASWRTLNVERGCPLTARLLVLDGRLEEAVAAFAAARVASPYGEELAASFLEFAAREDRDPLVRAVAGLEEALRARVRGDRRRRTLAWPQDPEPVVRALLAGRAPERRDAPHEVVVDGTPPAGFTSRSARPPGSSRRPR